MAYPDLCDPIILTLFFPLFFPLFRPQQDQTGDSLYPLPIHIQTQTQNPFLHITHSLREVETLITNLIELEVDRIEVFVGFICSYFVLHMSYF